MTSFNPLNLLTEIGNAVKEGETDILSGISTMTGNLSKNANIGQFIIETGTLVAGIASKYPDPKVQLIAGLASAILTEVEPLVAAAAATPAAAPK